MLEPFLELMLDATDTALTVIVLLALWEGRTARGRQLLAQLLRKSDRTSDLESFVHDARRLGGQGNREVPGA
jgi:S-adenosylmethionine:diacylglycerol 3-amino-3-carboxypropyl transferase